jgi:lysophospholipase L1-like esterase
MRITLVISISLNIFFAIILVSYSDKIMSKYFPKRKEQRNIAMFGNSLVAHEDWQKLLKRTDVQNSGYPGFTTYTLLKLIHPAVLEYNPKICFIEGGINDISAGVAIGKTFENLKSVVDTLMAYNIRPVIVYTFYTSDTNYNKSVDILNQLLKNYAQSCHIKTIDLNPEISAHNLIKSEFTTDGIHLKDEAYVIWSKEIEQILSLSNSLSE